ncbi:MAG: multicomponent Na+:H+ antiporter subunit E [Verrucomicrobiales bacterium]|jgi:multicomponent Na+:H+ antiporter subunit E
MHKLFIFTILLSSWLVFSGKFDAFHVGLGVVSTLLVTLSFGDLLFAQRKTGAKDRVRELLRLPGYLTWLLWQIVVANLHVLKLALLPRGPEEIKPRIVRFKTHLTSDFARFVFAQSITLTPGTVTVDIDGDEFVVHAISRAAAEGLTGKMEERVARVFEPELLREAAK